MEHPILTSIRRAGFTPLGWFEPGAADAVPHDAKFVILVGNAGPDMFRRFAHERDHRTAKIDEWTRDVIGGLADDLSAKAVFPFDTPPLPFLTWARRAGAGHVSPLGLNIHPTYGLWHAFRAALLFPVAFDLPMQSAGAHPCETCADKPCLSACPVHAFDGSSYNVAACATHLETPAGEDCMSGGCLARRACPVGRGFTYHPVQAQFFMRAFRAARRNSAGNAAKAGYCCAMYKSIQQKLDNGQTIILDGGTGTDIQRRGAPMSGETWCAEVNLTHPDIVRAVHEDYIRAGADIITANTFASSALSFNHYGRDDDLLEIDTAAVAIAKQAAAGKPVAVAGSVSTMRPVQPGTDRTLKDRDWPEAQARDLFRRKVENLKRAGVDLLMMEMMRDLDYSVYATEAAIATGLPVWVGISVERGEGGKLVGFGREDQLYEDVARRLAATKPSVISIMHTSPNDTDEALQVLQKYWDGPIGTYPESGYFKMPDWQFIDIISPEELVSKSRGWKAQGATIFGGCCGVGPDHIAALAKEFS